LTPEKEDGGCDAIVGYVAVLAVKEIDRRPPARPYALRPLPRPMNPGVEEEAEEDGGNSTEQVDPRARDVLSVCLKSKFGGRGNGGGVDDGVTTFMSLRLSSPNVASNACSGRTGLFSAVLGRCGTCVVGFDRKEPIDFSDFSFFPLPDCCFDEDDCCCVLASCPSMDGIGGAV